MLVKYAEYFVFTLKHYRELAHEFLKNPIKVTIGSDDLAAGTRITQIVEVIDDRAREARLTNLLKVVVFCFINRVVCTNFVIYKI